MVTIFFQVADWVLYRARTTGFLTILMHKIPLLRKVPTRTPSPVSKKCLYNGGFIYLSRMFCGSTSNKTWPKPIQKKVKTIIYTEIAYPLQNGIKHNSVNARKLQHLAYRNYIQCSSARATSKPIVCWTKFLAEKNFRNLIFLPAKQLENFYEHNLSSRLLNLAGVVETIILYSIKLSKKVMICH